MNSKYRNFPIFVSCNLTNLIKNCIFFFLEISLLCAYIHSSLTLLLQCKNEKKGESDKDIHNMVITGLQLLSKWTSTITELVSN